MNPSNWTKYEPNLPPDLRRAFKECKNLPLSNVGIYLQDKSSRICFANLSKTNEKVDKVLSDADKYQNISTIDPATSYQVIISRWYSSSKSSLKSVSEDLTSWICPSKVSTPHLRIMLKNHKQGCPVRLTFSSVGTVTRNLSTMLDTIYLKPTLPTFCPRRLTDTRETARFLQKVNQYLWDNNIQDKPTIYSMDVVNFFPTVSQELALPAITAALKKYGFQRKEINAVLEGFKILRKGSFFKWKENFWQQIRGCALGDVDSCSYTDIAMAFLLQSMIPAVEKALSTNMDWFSIYRDDGLGITLDDPTIVPNIQQFFNRFNNDIQWTIPDCSICHSPEVACPHYDHLDFLDTRITWNLVDKDNIKVWQFTMSAYSKPTDIHAYLSPTSCTAPHLNEEGVSVAKTVGVRLRTIHSNDADLLHSLNLYSGYLIARGYQEKSVKYHLSCMANRDRTALLLGQYKPKPKVTVPLVTNLHPAITCLSSIVPQSFSPAIKEDPLLNIILPFSSLIVSYRKLPNLTRILCSPDQNKFATNPPLPSPTGFVDTGCKCQVCKASCFGNFAVSPSLPGFKIPIPSLLSCSSGPAVVYHLTCKSGRPECRRAHYVGMASTTEPAKKPMSLRWSNHKSHHKKGRNMCGMTSHLLTCHKGEDMQRFVSITILEECLNQELAKEKETAWCHRLFSFHPAGLNCREERTL